MAKEKNPKVTTRQATHVQKRREEGLCGREGCPNKSATFYCPEHKAKHRKRMRAARAGTLRSPPGMYEWQKTPRS